KASVKLKVSTLCVLAFLIGAFGLVVANSDLRESHNLETVLLKRHNLLDYGSQYSLNWYQGKEDWLFLGNGFADTVAKLTLDIRPTEEQIEATVAAFSGVASAAQKYGTKVALMVGPNKSSIYPEYLPAGIVPSDNRYIDFFLKRLQTIPNLTLYDPTSDLLKAKQTKGLLYWKTDTHWNFIGAYSAYEKLLMRLGVTPVSVTFKKGRTFAGDLAVMSGFKSRSDEVWDISWETPPEWAEVKIRNEQKTAFGEAVVVTNHNPVSNKIVWVVGDSFITHLK